MNLWQIASAFLVDAVRKIKISRRSKRKLQKAANQSVDAAANVAIDILKSLRKS
ncbi:MAG: hypothetical protein IIY93_11905 [Clostridia bacterium]|nr:hypothetical protein [Clostridia bacterium]MBQ1555953.1 hypothetical protein [Clostridia bacterium]MBQ4396555.1 hypothetical protein [Clostridia bacterium]